MARHVLQEMCVVNMVADEWSKLVGVVLAFFPEVQVVMSENAQFLSKTLYRVNYLFNKDLKDGIGSCETLAIFVTKFLIIVILPLQDELCSITLPLIDQVAIYLLATSNGTLVDILVALLLWKDVVLILNDEFYVLGEVLIEPVKLW